MGEIAASSQVSRGTSCYDKSNHRAELYTRSGKLLGYYAKRLECRKVATTVHHAHSLNQSGLHSHSPRREQRKGKNPKEIRGLFRLKITTIPPLMLSQWSIPIMGYGVFRETEWAGWGTAAHPFTTDHS